MDVDESWRDRYLVSAAITNPGERAALYRGAERGAFARVARGAYLRVEDWATLGPEQRHLARMRAIELTHPGTVFSHLSAALVWGFPVVGGDLSIPFSVVDPASGGRSMTGLRRYGIGRPDDSVLVGGLTVTSRSATVLHVAAGFRPEVSVPVVDAALGGRHPVARDALRESAARIPASSGSARCTWALEFADPRSGSAGESLSRVGIHRLRLPAPELQQRFLDRGGLVGVVDFWWPDFGLIGEFDGLGKYLREEFAKGRSPAEVVIAEKRREDRLRALGPRVVRWEWDAARHAPTLRGILTSAGLRAP